MIAKEIFFKLSSKVFSELQNDEALILSLCSEDTFFMRFSQSKVRQIGEVEQSHLTFQFSLGKKTISSTVSLDKNTVEENLINILKELRQDVASLPDDPHFTPILDGESTEEVISGQLLQRDIVVETILSPLSSVDAAGIYCSGKVIRATSNSKGQKHWFENDSFFVDYSLYSAKQKAVKGCYAGQKFDHGAYLTEVKDKIGLLSKVSLPSRVIQPGKYRAYFAPAAVAEILSMMSWRGLSYSALKQGQSPLRALNDGEVLNSKVNLSEDFSLGFSPRFNEQGEVANEKLMILSEGNLKNTLISTRSSKEYNTEGNFAHYGEIARSLNLSPGTLDESQILKQLNTGLYISNLHYLNWSDLQNGRITGMTRFACFWVENAEIVAPIEDLRFDESFYHFLGDGLLDLSLNAQTFPDTSTYDKREVGALKSPGLLVNNFSFTL